MLYEHTCQYPLQEVPGEDPLTTLPLAPRPADGYAGVRLRGRRLVRVDGRPQGGLPVGEEPGRGVPGGHGAQAGPHARPTRR